MKFKFSVTVKDNDILQVLVKQSLITRNVRTQSKIISKKKKDKTDLIAMSAFPLNLHSKFNNNFNNNNLLYKMISIKKKKNS